VSSTTESLISGVFKGQVLWDNRIKDYNNRDFVDKECRKTSGNIAFTSICKAEQQKSQDEKISNLGGKPGIRGKSAFSEDATSEIQDPVPTAHLRASKKKRGKSTLSYQAEIISLENSRLE
jgi:hypothetical protein